VAAAGAHFLQSANLMKSHYFLRSFGELMVEPHGILMVSSTGKEN
jgi:dipeptide/tripeptide permease